MIERENRPTASPVYTLPSEDDVAQAIYAVDYPGKSDLWETESRAGKNEYRAYARAVLALIPPQQCAPSVDEVAQGVNRSLVQQAQGELIELVADDEMECVHRIARAVAKLYGEMPSVAQVKTEALLEAAEYIVLREDHVGCPSCRVNAEAEAEVWLRSRAAAIENGASRG